MSLLFWRHSVVPHASELDGFLQSDGNSVCLSSLLRSCQRCLSDSCNVHEKIRLPVHFASSCRVGSSRKGVLPVRRRVVMSASYCLMQHCSSCLRVRCHALQSAASVVCISPVFWLSVLCGMRHIQMLTFYSFAAPAFQGTLCQVGLGSGQKRSLRCGLCGACHGPNRNRVVAVPCWARKECQH